MSLKSRGGRGREVTCVFPTVYTITPMALLAYCVLTMFPIKLSSDWSSVKVLTVGIQMTKINKYTKPTTQVVMMLNTIPQGPLT